MHATLYARGNDAYCITDALTVTAADNAMGALRTVNPEFNAAFLVGFAEWACAETLRPYLADGETSVGTLVQMNCIGARNFDGGLSAKVRLTEAQDGRLRFEVCCRDDRGLIAEGVHERMVVAR